MHKSQTIFPIQAYPPQGALANQADESLAQSAAQNKDNSNAFSVLYQRYCIRVYRYQMARCGNAADAEDLCAQTFLAALENIQRFRGEGSFAAWLFGIARKKTALHHRSLRRHSEFALEAAEQIADPLGGPENQAAQSLLLERIYTALGSLPTERAEAVLLCTFGDLNTSEAGRVLGKSPAAVKMAVSRGLRDLRQRLNWINEEQS